MHWKSQAAGGGSASGHLGTPPASWPGGPRSAASVHYTLPLTLGGVRLLGWTRAEKIRLETGESEEHHGHKLVTVLSTHTSFRRLAVQVT